MNENHTIPVGRVSRQGVTRQRHVEAVGRVLSGYAALTRPTGIGFNRRPPVEIEAELAEVEKRIMGMLREVTE